jgi:hypothetical protein
VDGLTRAQIRTATVAALQAAAPVGGLVASASVLDSVQTPTVYADGPTITVWTDAQDMQPTAQDSFGYQVYAVETDVVLGLRAPGTAGSEESAADVADAMIAALLESQTWMELADNGVPSVRISAPFRADSSDRTWMCVEAVVTLRHRRAYASA